MPFDSSKDYNTGCLHLNNKSVVCFTAAEQQDEMPRFDALIAAPLLFREAFAVFHSVITRDINEQFAHRINYERWLRQNKIASEIIKRRKRLSESEQFIDLKEQLKNHIRQNRRALFPYQKAQKRYLRYCYQQYLEQQLMSQPWVSIHPDMVFFETFTRSQLLYCRLDLDISLFSDIKVKQYGSTTVAYNVDLDKSIEKIRDYRHTRLSVLTSAAVEADGAAQVQQRKSLDHDYLRGLLQINTSMAMLTRQFELSAIDIHNLCYLLSNQKQSSGTSALEIELVQGEPVKLHLGSSGKTLVCSGSIYSGPGSQRIRHWFCKDLLLLARLVPLIDRVTVHVRASGWPVFYVAHMKGIRLTLGLSGWRIGDWTRKAFHDLLKPHDLIDDFTRVRILKTIWENRSGTAAELAKLLKMSEKKVVSALQSSLQEGAVMYDFNKQLFRFRQWVQEEVHVAQYRFEDEIEAKAHLFVDQQKVVIDQCSAEDDQVLIQGTVTDKAIDYQPDIVLDAGNRLVRASCFCHFYMSQGLNKGPCEHMLALRIAYHQQNGEV